MARIPLGINFAQDCVSSLQTTNGVLPGLPGNGWGPFPGSFGGGWADQCWTSFTSCARVTCRLRAAPQEAVRVASKTVPAIKYAGSTTTDFELA